MIKGLLLIYSIIHGSIRKNIFIRDSFWASFFLCVWVVSLASFSLCVCEMFFGHLIFLCVWVVSWVSIFCLLVSFLWHVFQCICGYLWINYLGSCIVLGHLLVPFLFFSLEWSILCFDKASTLKKKPVCGGEVFLK